jgi:hypothetical protein
MRLSLLDLDDQRRDRCSSKVVPAPDQDGVGLRRLGGDADHTGAPNRRGDGLMTCTRRRPPNRSGRNADPSRDNEGEALMAEGGHRADSVAMLLEHDEKGRPCQTIAPPLFLLSLRDRRKPRNNDGGQISWAWPTWAGAGRLEMSGRSDQTGRRGGTGDRRK